MDLSKFKEVSPVGAHPATYEALNIDFSGRLFGVLSVLGGCGSGHQQ